jgi:hypothetical protein
VTRSEHERNVYMYSILETSCSCVHEVIVLVRMREGIVQASICLHDVVLRHRGQVIWPQDLRHVRCLKLKSSVPDGYKVVQLFKARWVTRMTRTCLTLQGPWAVRTVACPTKYVNNPVCIIIIIWVGGRLYIPTCYMVSKISPLSQRIHHLRFHSCLLP